jgi:hypothetical protein
LSLDNRPARGAAPAKGVEHDGSSRIARRRSRLLGLAAGYHPARMSCGEPIPNRLVGRRSLDGRRSFPELRDGARFNVEITQTIVRALRVRALHTTSA